MFNELEVTGEMFVGYDEHQRKICMTATVFMMWYESLPDISKKSEDQEGCAICHQEYQADEIISTLLCKHSYHEACIEEWLSHKKECPICRSFSKISLTNSII